MPAATTETEVVKTVGANGQISLGKKYAGRHVLVEEREPGVWLVRTATVIPDDQRWVWEPEHMRKLQDALAWSLANPADPSTTDAILKKLHDSL
jgi:hypothetical protein